MRMRKSILLLLATCLPCVAQPARAFDTPYFSVSFPVNAPVKHEDIQSIENTTHMARTQEGWWIFTPDLMAGVEVKVYHPTDGHSFTPEWEIQDQIHGLDATVVKHTVSPFGDDIILEMKEGFVKPITWSRLHLFEDSGTDNTVFIIYVNGSPDTVRSKMADDFIASFDRKNATYIEHPHPWRLIKDGQSVFASYPTENDCLGEKHAQETHIWNPGARWECQR
jgi:hypothetical protein